MPTDLDREWLLAKSNEEDNCIVSVGGLVCRVVAAEATGSEDTPDSARRVALSHEDEALREYVEIAVDPLKEV